MEDNGRRERDKMEDNMRRERQDGGPQGWVQGETSSDTLRAGG